MHSPFLHESFANVYISWSLDLASETSTERRNSTKIYLCVVRIMSINNQIQTVADLKNASDLSVRDGEVVSLDPKNESLIYTSSILVDIIQTRVVYLSSMYT